MIGTSATSLSHADPKTPHVRCIVGAMRTSLVLAAFVAQALACSSTTTNVLDSGATPCTAGRTHACGCLGLGNVGVQTCAPSGVYVPVP